MGEQTEPTLLRPLSVGEIFDRAVTLLVRNWAPFGIIAAIAVLPSHVALYLAGTVSPFWAIAYYPLLLLTLVGTLAGARIVAQIYRREQTDWKSAAGVGFSHLLGAIGANITIGLVAMLPLLIVVGIPAGLGVFRFSNSIADVVAVLVALCGGAIFVGAQFAGTYALSAMAIDGYSRWMRSGERSCCLTGAASYER